MRFFLLSFFIACLVHPLLSQEDERLPNVIIIFTDDLGYGDLGIYGHPTIRTPHLDQMAIEGMRFMQFYAAASVCTPSRAGLLTGRYPVRTGMVQGMINGRVLFPNDKVGLPPAEITIAEVVKQKNYATAAIGKWHLGHLPEYLPTAQGFDSYYGIPYSNDMDFVSARDGQAGYWNVPLMRNEEIVERPAVQETLTKRYTEAALDFIEKNRENPFLLYLAHTMPHIPLFASENFLGKSPRGLYGDVVEEIDWSVGQILQKLKESGLADNTLVIFTSDNGPWLVTKQNGGSAGLLREGKGVTWEGGLRVPMIAWWPGKIPNGKVSTALTSTIDFLPTIADMIGAEVNQDRLDGKNILPVLLNEAPSPREDFFYYRGDRVFAVRKGPWKAHFITQTEYPAGPMTFHDPPLLFHLENDPSERFNLAENHPNVIEELKSMKEAHEATVKTTSQPSIEAEALIEQARVSGGRLRVQGMKPFKGEWGGDQQLWWVEASPGDQLTLPLEVEKSGDYSLYGYFTRAKDYGIIQVKVNGQSVGAFIDCFAEGVEPTGPLKLGEVPLRAGKNELTIELVGKDIRAGGYSNGYLVGVDGFLVK